MARERMRGGEFLIQDSAPEEVLIAEDRTEEQLLIAESTQAFVDTEILPQIETLESGCPELIVQLMRRCAELGLLGADVPEEYGGAGLDRVSSMQVTERLSQVGSFAVSYGAHAGIGTLPIVYFGNPEQKQQYLPRLASGELLAAYALTEPEAGSDALASRTRADLDRADGSWILNGEKIWISNGGFADLFIVFAKVGGTDFSAFIVERAFGGVSSGAEEKKMGIKGSSTCALRLENVRVPAGNLLGEAGQGHKVALNILNLGRFKLGAGCVGAARRALREARQYASQRRQFGRPIIEFGAIQEKLAEMQIRCWVAESMSYRTAGLIETALADVLPTDSAGALEILEEFAVECSILKVWASEMLDYVVDEVVQVFGGNGYSLEYPVERYYRDSRINRIFEGTNEINRLMVSGLLLKRARKGELPLREAALGVLSELGSSPASGGGPGFLSVEKQAVARAKKASLLVSAAAARRFGDALAQEQELLIALSNMIHEIFAMESALLRTLKLKGRNGTQSEAAEEMTSCFIHGGIQRLETWGSSILWEAAEGDERRTLQAALKGFCRHPGLPSIRLRRRIAGRMLQPEPDRNR